MTHSDQSICQLTQNANTLAAVATNESRYLSIEKSFRGAVVTVVFFTMMVFYIGLNIIPTVQAEPTEPPWGEIVTALKEIATAQTKIAQAQTEIAHVMTSMTKPGEPFPVLLTRMKVDSDMIRCYLDGKPSTCDQKNLKGLGLAMLLNAVDKAMKKQEEQLNEAVCKKNQSEGKQCTLSSVKPVDPITSLAGMLTLIHRLRIDSDTARIDNGKQAGSDSITKEIGEVLKMIHEALKMIHKALAAVPQMAHEMHIMNMYMSVMSRDMDSTMGRMGRMMPGGWW
jgi:hypothetical protein